MTTTPPPAVTEVKPSTPQTEEQMVAALKASIAAAKSAACAHVSAITPDGYGAYCRVCGETLA